MPHRGDYSKCRFCPKCGVESLEFDRYRENKGFPKAEFICRTCAFGFCITQSARVTAADTLFRQSRKVRDGKFSDGVAPEVAEKWIEFTEKRHQRWYHRLLRRGTTA